MFAQHVTMSMTPRWAILTTAYPQALRGRM